MLGHIKPCACRLSPEARQHYQHLYCSICYSLRTQFGLPASFLINHELTLSLAAFPEYRYFPTENRACPARGFCAQKSILRDARIDKAASLCLLLVWLKLVDWETDRPAFYKTRLRIRLEQKVQPVLSGLNAMTQQFIEAYLLLVRSGSPEFTVTVNRSGLLAVLLFQELAEDLRTTNVLTQIVELLGQLMTVSDALLDLKNDSQNHEYNPIISASALNNTTLQQEQALLRQQHGRLVQTIRRLCGTDELQSANPVFCELLQQSLNTVTANIDRESRALFAAPNDRAQDNRRGRRRRSSGGERSWCDCTDPCCDCVCEGCDSACCGESRCCSCCDCGGCGDGCACDC